MVSTIQSGAEWQPRFTAHSFNQEKKTEAFTVAPESPTADEEGFSAFGEDGFTLLDAIDVINPLQHLPLVGTLYRELTGDTIEPFSRVAGSTLYFGPLGTAVSGVNVAMEEFTGKDIGGHMVAFFKGSEAPSKGTEIALKPTAVSTSSRSPITQVSGTDSGDPVTAWARSEIQYRNELAQQQGLAVKDTPYSSLVADVAKPQRTETAQSTEPVKWAPLHADEVALLSGAASQPQPVAEKQTAPDKPAPEPMPMNLFQAEHRASPETLLRMKRTAQAYQTMAFAEDSASSVDKQGENDETGQTPKDATPPATDRQAQTVLFPQSTGAPNAAAKPESNRGQGNSTSWFSASMMEALGKYKQAETTNKGALDQLTSNGSLH